MLVLDEVTLHPPANRHLNRNGLLLRKNSEVQVLSCDFPPPYSWHHAAKGIECVKVTKLWTREKKSKTLPNQLKCKYLVRLHVAITCRICRYLEQTIPSDV